MPTCLRCGTQFLAAHDCKTLVVGECECGWSTTSSEIIGKMGKDEARATLSIPGAIYGAVAGYWSRHRDDMHKGRTDISCRIYFRERVTVPA